MSVIFSEKNCTNKILCKRIPTFVFVFENPYYSGPNAIDKNTTYKKARSLCESLYYTQVFMYTQYAGWVCVIFTYVANQTIFYTHLDTQTLRYIRINKQTHIICTQQRCPPG